MSIIENYLNKIQKEAPYSNPIQTRPKPEPGISREKIKRVKAGSLGPSGIEVDLDKDEVSGYSFVNKFFKDEEDEDN
ncbi:MAG: hypothetical protein ACFFG0_04180 [Candidatus Thorarchaeota archaeon]